MRHFELVVGDLAGLRARLPAGAEHDDGRLEEVDPSGNRLLLRAG
jgi:hypothetical protein